MAKDLRAFIEQLAAAAPDQIHMVTRRVDRRFDVTSIAERLGEDGRFPALFFTDVEGSSMPLVINLTATYERLALALGASVPDMARVYGERQANPIQAETVSDGPVKEVVIKGDAVDLSALPIPFHNEMDAGPYVTGGVMILRDPDTGAQNAGLYRHQVHDPRTLGVYIQGSHHGGYIYRRNSERGEPTEFALVIGHYPTFMLGAVSRLPGIGGEFAEAGALLQEPIELVKAETVDLMVPAHAEIVIEGRLLPDETRLEGPFGEWTGYYVSVGAQPVMHVSAMTMRRNPIYYDVFPAGQEHLVLGSLPRMGTIYRRVREAVPGVVNVNVPAHARTHCYISIRKTRDSEVKRAAMAAISTEPENLRCVVVVDDDINVFNEPEVTWAVGTRMRPDKDVLTIPDWNGPGDLLPSNWTYTPDGAHEPVMGAVMILDATKPAPPVQYPQRARPPQDKVREVRLEGLLQPFDPSLMRSPKTLTGD